MIFYSISSIKRLYAIVRVFGTQLVQAFTLLAFTCLVNAAELGELRIFSTLGEPLRAEIDLVNMEDISEAELEVGMAPDEAFEQSGALMESYLSDIRFSVISTRDSSKVIRVLSDRPIENPFLNFILELRWPLGKKIKEYSAMLQLPEQESSLSRYGPVKEKDTLWSISEKFRPSRSISVQQMMLAIQRKNANSFLENNINLLRAGTFLRIPSILEIGVESPEKALSEVRSQIERYQKKDFKAPTKAMAETERPAVGSELKLLSLDKKASLLDAPPVIDRLAFQEKKLVEAVGQLKIANESINELNSRLERLSSELDNLSEALSGKDKEIDALRRELRRKDKETLDLGKLLEFTRSIHPALDDPYWSLGSVGALISVILLLLLFLLRRSGSENNKALNTTYDDSGSILEEPNFNDSVRQEKVENESSLKTVGETFIDDVSEVRIKETSEEDIENDSVSNVSASAETEEISFQSESRPPDQDRSMQDNQERAVGSHDPEDGFEKRPPETEEEQEQEQEQEQEDDIDSTDSKLDLARAYIEMGDTDGARTLLAEIINIGTPAQQIEAKELLLRVDTKSD